MMMTDPWIRTAWLIGDDALDRLRQSHVAVFGIGGVGSYAAEALARCGVGHLTLIDPDIIVPSNINRQIHALHSTLGQLKVNAMRDRILDINPSARVDCHAVFFQPGLALETLAGDAGYIVDAIDTVASKVDLIVQATKAGRPVISCMGAGNKLDPAAFEVTDLCMTSVCPLSKVMRRLLRQQGIVHVKVVYSREQPRQPGSPDRQDQSFTARNDPQGPGDTASAEAIGYSSRLPARRSSPGSISFVPSAAGLVLAGAVINDLISGTSQS